MNDYVKKIKRLLGQQDGSEAKGTWSQGLMI